MLAWNLPLERRTHLRSGQPLVLGLQVVHDLVKLVQVLVPEQGVVDEVELTSRVLEGTSVALTGEVHPSAGGSQRCTAWMSSGKTYSG